MKTIWKKLSAGLLAFALVFAAIPPIGVNADTTGTGETAEKEEYVIDISTADQVSLPAQGLDVVYVLSGTNTATDVYIHGDCDIILRGATLNRIYTNYAESYTVNITLEGANTIDQTEAASEGALSVYSSNVTINGGENDSLYAKSRAFCGFSSNGDAGGITVNGGNITFEGESGSALATTYTQNGGTVKTINANESSFRYALNLNGGTLEIEHKAANNSIFNNPVKIKNGASMKVTGPETPGEYFSFNGPIGLADGAAADDCLLVRFDNSSDFVYLDEGNEILRGKTYAEIKAVTHTHTYENGICSSCGFVCAHDTDDGTCGKCEAYVYKIKHHPTEEEPYVALNDGTGASYQWYEVKNISEITDESKIYPWSYFGAPFEEDSTYDAAAGWTPIDDSYEGDSYKSLYYIASSFKAGDKVTLRFSSPVEYAELFAPNEEAYAECEIDGTTATAILPSNGVYGICAMTKDTEPTVKVYVGDGEVSTLTGQTGVALSKYSYGNYYFCEATAKDGTVLTSGYADFTYKITHQPTDDAQYVSLNDSTGASYQWYEEKGGIVSVTDENAISFTVLGAPSEIGGTYDSETGWTPDEYGYYFVVWLDEGDVVNFEFTQAPSECMYLFSSAEGNVESEAAFDTSLTAPASGYYGIRAEDGGALKATMDGTEYTAVSGQTDATLNASELGRYRCEVTFGNGTKKTSDVVEVQHLHAGGTATCKDKAICTTCGIGYGPLSTEHKYDNACDTECNVCRTTRIVTHDYNEATCTDPKTCKVCGNEEGEALGHTPGPEATSTTPQICTVCLSELAPATGTTPDPGTGDSGNSGGGTTDPGTGTTPDSGTGDSGSNDDGAQDPPDKGGSTTPGTGGGSLVPTPTPNPGTTPGTGGESGDSGGGTTDPGTGTTPEPEHQCTYKTTKTKATTTKNGKVVVKCTECGKVKSTKTIYKASGVKLKTASFVYNGKQKSPAVVVKDSKGKTIAKSNYTITKPKGRKAIGKYTYTIKFKGDYSGTKKLTLTIKPVKPTIQTPKAAKKAITVKWKKGKKAQVTGYQVMVATNSKFTKNKKTATVKGYTKVSKKMTKLKAKTKYYVKVRTYKTVKGVKIYSNWSKVKTIKTK